MNAIEKTNEVTKDLLVNYMNAFGIASGLKENEKMQFVEIATAYQLNPFKREIYCVAFGENEKRKLQIITGYEVYLKRAERTGKMDGWEADIEGEGEERCAKVTIYRKDWNHPFIHKVYWKECKQMTYDREKKIFKLNSMWDKMGNFMLKKVATAQAFRLCFPDEMGGLPYTSDELPDEMTTGFNAKNVTPEAKQVTEKKKPKGNYEKAKTAILSAKSKEELEKYIGFVSASEWTEEEDQLLFDLIDSKKKGMMGAENE